MECAFNSDGTAAGVEKLRAAILAGVFKPGDRLIERTCAACRRKPPVAARSAAQPGGRSLVTLFQRGPQSRS